MPHDDDIGPLNLPSAIEIAGGAVTTAREPDGHLLWFDHDAIAEMGAQDFVGTQIVKDHETSISARAGTVRRSSVERFDIEVPIVDPDELNEDDAENVIRDDDGTPRKLVERAARVDFAGLLQEKFEGFETVARHLLALDDEAETPHTSIMVLGSGIAYEPATDRFFMEGPIEPLHQGIVFQGAFNPDQDDVGIEVIEPLEATAEFDVDEEQMDLATELDESYADVTVAASEDGGGHVEVPLESNVVVANGREMAADFIDEHMDEPRLLEKLATALGLDEDLTSHTDGCRACSSEDAYAVPVGELSDCPEVELQEVRRTDHECELVPEDREYDTFRRDNDAGEHEGKRIDFLFGIDESEDEADLVAFLYPIEEWDEDESREHCTEEHDGRFEPAQPEDEDTSYGVGGAREISIDIRTDGTDKLSVDAGSSVSVAATDPDQEDGETSAKCKLRVPQNPDGGTGEGAEGEWDSSEHADLAALREFVDTDEERWEDFSESQKDEAAAVFADAAEEYTDNLDDDLNLPHHFTTNESAPAASLNGTRNALARLPQTEDLHSDASDIEDHLNEHLPDDEEEALWNAYLRDALTLDEVAERAGFELTALGLTERQVDELSGSGRLNDTEALSTDDNLNQDNGDETPDSGMGQSMSKDNEPDDGDSPLDADALKEDLKSELQDELTAEVASEVASDVKEQLTEVVTDTIEQRERQRELAEHKRRTARELGVSEDLFAKCETIDEVDEFAEELAAEVQPARRGGNRIEGVSTDPTDDGEDIDYREVVEKRQEERDEWLRDLTKMDFRDGSQSLEQVQRI